MGEILERPQAPARHRLDVDAYYKMAEAGILTRAHRVELIDGEIIDMNAIGSPHAAITNRLNRLVRQGGGGWTSSSLACRTRCASMLITNRNPISCCCGPAPTIIGQAIPARPTCFLLVEVSDSSLAYDRGRKLALYAKFGVAEVWIVDLAGAAVEVYRGPKEGGYSSPERRTGGSLTPDLVPSVAIDVAALLA